MNRQKATILFARLMASLMLVSSFMMPLVFFDYQIRKDFIAEVFCVNKDKPETLCYGKCHLRKQLTKAHNQKNDEQGATVEKAGIEIICLSQFVFDLDSVVYADILDAYPPYTSMKSMFRQAKLFHPPIKFLTTVQNNFL